MASLTLDPVQVASERQVILEEIRMYDDQPPFGADDKCRATFFNGHPLGRSVLGTVDTVSGLSVDAIRQAAAGDLAEAQTYNEEALAAARDVNRTGCDVTWSTTGHGRAQNPQWSPGVAGKAPVSIPTEILTGGGVRLQRSARGARGRHHRAAHSLAGDRSGPRRDSRQAAPQYQSP